MQKLYPERFDALYSAILDGIQKTAYYSQSQSWVKISKDGNW
ncbi:hypothetical protein Mic7113_0451 [Allocoleopsis franciscana PCC 7113]|uniref:Uncharacterized protein n=1 Tax=Allocoleopsis franciscana PCC 7113 TaxID=1173027 RepID=K9W7K5_9CYAN|nr:hypothetical protein Mic7113_0451 [Allocoleopsis franciscana PCC 7113]